MNANHAVRPSPQWLAAMAARVPGSAGTRYDRLTINGVMLLLIGVVIFFSGLASTRLHVFNLRLQPFLIAVVPTIPLALATRLPKFPIKVLIGFISFFLLYALASIGPSSMTITPMESVLKLGVSIAVIITVALLVSSRADFVLGSLGLCVAIGGLAFKGLEEEQVNVIEVANKNSYSMYALPAVLLALYIAMRTDWKRVSFRKLATPIMLLASIISSVAITSGGNRSGWLGLALIVLMMGLFLVFSRRLRFMLRSRGIALLTGMVTVVVAGLIYKGVETFAHRYDQTVEGYSSDTERWELFINAIAIGIQHPVRGVCPTYLPFVLEQRLDPNYTSGPGTDPHNVFGHIIGGAGLVTTAALFFTGWALFTWLPVGWKRKRILSGFFDARTLLRMMLFLWAVRGMFSAEILYNPGFCMGLGLAIGLCMVEVDATKQEMAARPYPIAGRAGRPLQSGR